MTAETDSGVALQRGGAMRQQGRDWKAVFREPGAFTPERRQRLQSALIADRKAIADAGYTGHDAERARAGIVLHQAEINTLEARPPAVPSAELARLAMLHTQADVTRERADRLTAWQRDPDDVAPPREDDGRDDSERREHVRSHRRGR